MQGKIKCSRGRTRYSGENRGRKMLGKQSIMSRLVDAQVRKKNSSRGFEGVTSWSVVVSIVVHAGKQTLSSGSVASFIGFICLSVMSVRMISVLSGSNSKSTRKSLASCIYSLILLWGYRHLLMKTPGISSIYSLLPPQSMDMKQSTQQT